MTAESYNEKYAPLLGEWTIKRCIGSGSYGRVFEIERRDALGTVNTSALKIISLPQSEDDLRSTIETNNLTGDSVSSYYRSCADAITNEIKLMSELKAQSNIVSYEDHKIVPHKDGIGWDILIRMELLTPLNVHLQRTVQMPRGEVVRMGIHLCRALELCQRHNIIHRDVKSENIFISADGNYKLGDFGVARTVLASSGALTQVGSPSYMAPEMFQAGKTYNASVDTYALGLVLYRCLNEGRLPFYPPYPQPLTPEDRNMAEGKRLSGLELPRAVNATAALDAILRKACAPDPAGRFASPTEMRLALEKLLNAPESRTMILPLGKPDAAVNAAETEKTADMWGGSGKGTGEKGFDTGRDLGGFGGKTGGTAADDNKTQRIFPGPGSTTGSVSGSTGGTAADGNVTKRIFPGPGSTTGGSSASGGTGGGKKHWQNASDLSKADLPPKPDSKPDTHSPAGGTGSHNDTPKPDAKPDTKPDAKPVETTPFTRKKVLSAISALCKGALIFLAVMGGVAGMTIAGGIALIWFGIAGICRYLQQSKTSGFQPTTGQKVLLVLDVLCIPVGFLIFLI